MVGNSVSPRIGKGHCMLRLWYRLYMFFTYGFTWLIVFQSLVCFILIIHKTLTSLKCSTLHLSEINIYVYLYAYIQFSNIEKKKM
jgi:hypothetical protein